MATNDDTEYSDPDDMFKDTRMSFGEHIEDLRVHLIRALKCFAIGMLLGFWPLGPYVLKIIIAPVEQQLFEFEKRQIAAEMAKSRDRYARRGQEAPRINLRGLELNEHQLRKVLNLKSDEPAFMEAITRVLKDRYDDIGAGDIFDDELANQSRYGKVDGRIQDPAFIEQISQATIEMRRPNLKTLEVTEAFMVYVKIALVSGLVISSPWVFYHIWMFVAAGLYPHERRLVNVYLPLSIGLFIGGVMLCQFGVMPSAIRAMLWFNEWLGVSADLRLSEWLWFALMMPVIFGLSFQTPLVMMFLHRVGIVTVQAFRSYRRIVYFLMCVVAVVFMPTVDPQSILLLWGPMCALYELGIWLCIYQGEHEQDAEGKSESTEMVEV